MDLSAVAYRRRRARNAAIRRFAAAEPLTRRPERRGALRRAVVEPRRRDTRTDFFFPARAFLRFADFRPPRRPAAFCIASCVANVCWPKAVGFTII